MSGWLPVDLDRATEILERTESQLDPAHPEAGGHVQVLGYGEISAALTTDELPAVVCKRMAGYPDEASARSYGEHIGEYLVELRAAGLEVAPPRESVGGALLAHVVVVSPLSEELAAEQLDVSAIGQGVGNEQTVLRGGCPWQGREELRVGRADDV